MTPIVVSQEQAEEIFKAINGIGALLKRLPCKAEDAGFKHAIMANLELIQTTLNGSRMVNPN